MMIVYDREDSGNWNKTRFQWKCWAYNENQISYWNIEGNAFTLRCMKHEYAPNDYKCNKPINAFMKPAEVYLITLPTVYING